MRTSRRLLLPAVSLCALAFLAAGPAAAERPATSRAMTAVARQPLRFELLDRGLLARGSGYAMMLTPRSAAFSLSGTATVVRMTWPGADRRVQPVGEEPAAGTTNYLIGSDPSRWRRGVPSFARVRYRGLYPAIDLVFYGNQEQLEYDFVVAPGGDPRDIRLRFSGEDAVRIDAQGNLVIRAGATDIVQRAPVIYQEHDGTRRPVPGRYVKANRHEIGFSVPDYDRANTLYIDPVLTFSSFFGGNAENFAKAVAVDSAGSAYVTGYTASTNFPTTAGVYDTSCSACAFNNTDVFVTKISPTGVLVYSTYVGSGNTDDKGYAIAVDSAGNAYVTGETSHPGSGESFPVVGGFTITGGGGAFLFKLNSTGSNLLYSTHMRSGSSAVGYGVAVEGSNAYVAGTAVAGAQFPMWPTEGTYSGYVDPLPLGLYSAFIMKINTSAVGLASLTWATRFGGSDWNFAYAVAVNSAGQAYVTGYTTSFDFPTINAAQPECGTDDNCNTRVADAFVSKFNAAGNALLYSTFAGGSDTDSGYGIAIDASGNAYVAGLTHSPEFPTTPGRFDSTCGNNGLCDTFNDAFALKLSPSGSVFVYSTFLGGGSSEAARAIAVDSDGYAYVAGHTDSVDFPTVGAIQPAGAGDAFVSVIDPTGTALAYSSYLGGTASGGDEAFGIALDPAGDVWLVGQTDSANFPVKPGAIQTTHGAGIFDGFVVKIGEFLSLTAVIPTSGGTSGGPVRLTGTGFMAGAAVTFGGVAATSVSVVSPTTITAVRPAHALGTVDVVVTSLDGQVATLAGGFTYISVPALTFTDNPLQAQVTPVKAVHLTELRAAVNTIRTRYALPVVTWPSGAITSGTVVQAAHLTELRSALADVYNAAAIAVPTWSPATITGGTTVITAAQITQVRGATLAMW